MANRDIGISYEAGRRRASRIPRYGADRAVICRSRNSSVVGVKYFWYRIRTVIFQTDSKFFYPRS